MLRNQVMAPTGLGKCDNASVMTGVGGHWSSKIQWQILKLSGESGECTTYLPS